VANENRGFTDIDLVGREAFEHLISLAPTLS
jgi:BMFP domain-containing protein YqiC